VIVNMIAHRIALSALDCGGSLYDVRASRASCNRQGDGRYVGSFGGGGMSVLMARVVCVGVVYVGRSTGHQCGG